MTRHALPTLLLALLLASPSFADPGEGEGHPAVDGSYALSGAVLEVVDGHARLVIDGEATPVGPLVERPVVAPNGTRVVLARRPGDFECSVLEAWSLQRGRWTSRVLEADGCPDRAAMSGDRVAFVSGRTGIASLWVVDFGGGDAVQLTNLGLESAPPTPGRAPTGFVAPPHLGPPRFDGRDLVWDAPDGPHRMALP